MSNKLVQIASEIMAELYIDIMETQRKIEGFTYEIYGFQAANMSLKLIYRDHNNDEELWETQQLAQNYEKNEKTFLQDDDECMYYPKSSGSPIRFTRLVLAVPFWLWLPNFFDSVYSTIWKCAKYIHLDFD